MSNLSRPTALKIAAILSFLGGLFSLIASLPFLMQGAETVNNDPEGVPYVVILIGFVLGIVAIVAAYGTWKQQRWGIILTILANLLNGLSAAPGILFAPTTELFVAATTGVIISIVIIVLCLWPDRQVVTV